MKTLSESPTQGARAPALRYIVGLRLTLITLFAMGVIGFIVVSAYASQQAHAEAELLAQAAAHYRLHTERVDETLLGQAQGLRRQLEAAAPTNAAGATSAVSGLVGAGSAFTHALMTDASGKPTLTLGPSPLPPTPAAPAAPAATPATAGAPATPDPLAWTLDPGRRQVYRVVRTDLAGAGGDQARLLLFAPVDSHLLAGAALPKTRVSLHWQGQADLAMAPLRLAGQATPAQGGSTVRTELAWARANDPAAPTLHIEGDFASPLPRAEMLALVACGLLAGGLISWLLLGRWIGRHVQRLDGLSRATVRFSEERDPTELFGDRLRDSMNGATHDLLQLWRGLQSLAMGVDEAENAQQAAQQYLRDLNVHLEQRVEDRTRELAEARDRALDSTRAKEQFLANMSHELRTPLTGLLGGLELVNPASLPEQQRRLLDVARQSGQALLSVINDVLDYSKLESGKLALAQVPFRVDEVVSEASALFASVALRKGVTLDCRCEPGVEARVMGDPLHLRQVLLNLLGNALKFTDQGRVELKVERVARTADAALLQFSIQDSGIGISPALQTQLFQPFVQAEEGAQRKGSGLGLAISQRLVQAMGGRIKVNSVHGVGSTFSFGLQLPFAAASQAEETRAVSVDAETTRLSGRVLLVEDNPVNRMIASRMLEQLGLEVQECEDGQEALDRLKASAYDIVLMDCQMPVLDGFGATARIRAGDAGPQAARLPIVAFTANALDGDAQRCLAAGMDAYLAKPFTRDHLASMMARWLLREGAEPGSAAHGSQQVL